MRAALVTALAFVLACEPCDATWIRITNGAGETELASCADVARTEAERRAGLANRPPLAEGEGLLIEFPLVGEACLTSEGMAYDLDAVFLDTDGTVLDVERLRIDDTTPRCVDGVATALEVRAGEAASVRVGDRAEIEPEGG